MCIRDRVNGGPESVWLMKFPIGIRSMVSTEKSFCVAVKTGAAIAVIAPVSSVLTKRPSLTVTRYSSESPLAETWY